MNLWRQEAGIICVLLGLKHKNGAMEKWFNHFVVGFYGVSLFPVLHTGLFMLHHFVIIEILKGLNVNSSARNAAVH